MQLDGGLILLKHSESDTPPFLCLHSFTDAIHLGLYSLSGREKKISVTVIKALGFGGNAFRQMTLRADDDMRWSPTDWKCPPMAAGPVGPRCGFGFGVGSGEKPPLFLRPIINMIILSLLGF